MGLMMGSESTNGNLPNGGPYEIGIFKAEDASGPESVGYRIDSHWQNLETQHAKGGRWLRSSISSVTIGNHSMVTITMRY